MKSGMNQTDAGRRTNERGSTLVTVMCYLFIAVGLVVTMLDVATNHRKISQRQMNMEQALDVAEGGVEVGARWIESNLVTLVASSTGATNGSGTIGFGSYAYSITRSNGSTYSIISTGTVSGVTRTVSILRIYQPTYAEFAIWSHVNGGLYFKAGEVFNGHVHSDGQLYFDNASGGPVFHAAVTSLASSYVGSISGIEFDQGLTLNSYQGTMADIDFNSTASTSLKNVATSTGLVLQGNTTIQFNGSSVKITNSRAGWNNHSYSPAGEGIIYIQNATSGTSSTRPGIAYVTGGNVSGRLTIVTENDITIQGNITYANDPLTNPNSTDALGLISRDDINVDTSAPNNLQINAAMVATGTSGDGSLGSFNVTNYSSGAPRGNLTIYGGIVQNTRGAVGTFNSYTGATTHGYNKNYSYDPRFIDTPPPYYPVVGGKVEFSQWQEGH